MKRFGLPVRIAARLAQRRRFGTELPVLQTESGDKLLFTPGPLSTSLSVKKAMLSDMGSRDKAFMDNIKDARNGVVEVGNPAKPEDWTSIFVQGSGTFGIEATILSSVPKDGHLMVISNGAYGQRAAKIGQRAGIKTTEVKLGEDDVPTSENALKEIKRVMNESEVTNVLCVHSETTTGAVNDIQTVGELVKSINPNALYIVDAMSSFGGIPLELDATKVDFLVTSSNKCIQGVPGFAVVLCQKSALMQCEGRARSLSLDIFDQWKGLDANGQFRFTPPTHTILAFKQALDELKAEGGVEARYKRYRENQQIITDKLTSLGFKTFLPKEKRGPIITSFLYPESPSWDFDEFYKRLSDCGCLIYPGKVSKKPAFRIGHIGSLTQDDSRNLCKIMESILLDMGVITRKAA